MKKIFSLVVILLIICGLIWVSCQKKVEEKVVKIGAVAPLTGPAAPYGENIRDGILLAVNEINSLGGIKDKHIEIIFEDEGADPQQALLAVKKLVETNGIKVIIGPSSSNGILAAAPYANIKKVILFSCGAASDNVRDAGEFIFRNRASAWQEAAGLVRYVIKTLNPKKVLIFRTDADYGLSFSQVFKRILNKCQIKFFEESFPEGNRDFKPYLTKIFSHSNFDALLIVGAPLDVAYILRQIKEMGIWISIFTNSIESPDVIKIAQDAAEGVCFSTTFYDPTHGDKKLKEFDKKFREKYGRPSDLFAANGYDAVYILTKAIEIGGYDPVNIRDILYNTKFNTLMGEVWFDKKGDIKATIAIKKIQNGSFKFLEVMKP